MRQLIAIKDHPSNIDPSARIVAEDRLGRWSIYSVNGGFVLIVSHKAVEGLFATERDAHEAREMLLPDGPSSLAETFATA